MKRKPIAEVIETSFATVVIIDADRLEREVLKSSIADEDVQKLLPFNTGVSGGEHFYHIVNRSAYIVETNAHRIYEGETLCKRAGHTGGRYTYTDADCPGCLAKGKSIIVNHLLQNV
jgi:hypothetical protein